MSKSFISAINQVRNKQLNEFLDSKGNPKDPKELGHFSTNNDSKYGFAQGGSDEDTAANFFASSKRMQDDQAAQQAASKPAAPKPAPVPLPPRRPAATTGSQSSQGNGDILGGKTAAPVASPESGEAGIKKADEIANRTDAIEKTMKDTKPAGEKPSPANVIGADRNAGAQTGVTSRTLGVVAGATGGNAADERATSAMSNDEKKRISDQATARQAEINREREANIAANAEKRRKLQSQSSQPGFFSRLFGRSTTNEEAVEKILSMKPSSTNMFAEAKKLKGDQYKLDKNKNGKLDGQDFKMLRGEKVEEEKKADKDYDGDGKVESAKDEVWGSRFKAAKKAGKMEEAAEPALKKSTTTDPDFAVPSANPDAPESPIKFKEEPKAPPAPLPPKRPAGLKETYLNMLKKDH
jgi:hypothetical protein